MAGGRRHFNVWVAYSDLFSNLATFLFISAIGIFAAIGSGALGPIGQAPGPSCVLPARIDAALQRGGSVLKPVEASFSGSDAAAACPRYYLTGAYRFRTPTVFSFTDETGHAPTQAQIRDQICRPVWGALARKDFTGGRIHFIALAGAYGADGHAAVCGAPRTAEPPIAGLPSGPKARPHAEAISDCLVSGAQEAYQACGEVRKCLKAPYGRRSTWCRQVWAAYLGGSQSDAACRRQQAQLQAKQIYDQCTSVSDDQQEDQMFDAEDMVPEARRPDGRRQLWGRVDFESRPVERGNGNAALAPGTVLLEIRRQP